VQKIVLNDETKKINIIIVSLYATYNVINVYEFESKI